MKQQTTNDSSDIFEIFLSGTCYWCMEAIFQSLIGIQNVTQGWIAPKDIQISTKKTALFSPSDEKYQFIEGILIHFDPKIISLSTLIDIHLETHNATSDHALRDRYPSAIYTKDKNQQVIVAKILDKKIKSLNQKILTKSLIIDQFIASKDSAQNYYYANPEKPFCQSVISPKLRTLLKTQSKWVAKDKASIISNL